MGETSAIDVLTVGVSLVPLIVIVMTSVVPSSAVTVIVSVVAEPTANASIVALLLFKL